MYWLTFRHLHNNKLSGTLPEWPTLRNLTQMFVVSFLPRRLKFYWLDWSGWQVPISQHDHWSSSSMALLGCSRRNVSCPLSQSSNWKTVGSWVAIRLMELFQNGATWPIYTKCEFFLWRKSEIYLQVLTGTWTPVGSLVLSQSGPI